nr:MAG TPA: hypothetical protein [Caudoviricetes sp.]
MDVLRKKITQYNYMDGICKIRVPLSTPQKIPLELFKFQGDFHILIHINHKFV